MPVTKITSAEEFHSKVASEKLTVVDAFADWCGPCRMIAPTLEGYSNEYTDIQVIKFDVDALGDLAQEQKISAMPTFIFFKNGKEIDRMMGANPAGLKAKIEAHK